MKNTKSPCGPSCPICRPKYPSGQLTKLAEGAAPQGRWDGKVLKATTDFTSVHNYAKEYAKYYFDEAATINFTRYSALQEKPMAYDTADKLRHLTLSDDDRLLLDNDIINEDGSLTDTGEEVVADYALKQFKAQIVADLKTLKATDGTAQQTTQS